MDQTKLRNLVSLALVAAAAIVAWPHGTPQVSDPAVPALESAPVFSGVPASAEAVPLRGWFGYRPDPRAAAQFVGTLPQQTLRAAAPELFTLDARADREAVLLYRALYEVQPGWQVGAQGIGDCVSWGWAHAVDILLAVDYKLGKTGHWAPAATESIYGGSRVEARGVSFGGWSDGSYGAAAAKWCRDWGIVHRRDFPDLGFDLSRYSSQRAKEWGAYGAGGKEDAGRLDAIAKSHPIKTVVLVTNFNEAAAAISNGYPVPVCSGQGFASERDQDGFAPPRGSWAHCMCFIGVRHEPRPGLLCLNSWGPNWIRGPPWPNDMPAGSFWVDANVVDRMLSGRDSFAVSNYHGFPRRKLKHSEGW